MNWLVSDEVLSTESDDWESVRRTINYFVMRLDPLKGQDIGFVACNRIGTEQVSGKADPTTFTGSSCIVQLGVDHPIVIAFSPKDKEHTLRGDLILP